MDQIAINHPQINGVYELFINEKHPFTKVHRLIDLFETIIKTHTAVIISDYFRIKEVSDDIKGILAKGLITPSLGMWQVFSRAIMEDLAVVKVLTYEQYKEMENLLDKNQREKFVKLYEKQDTSYKLKQVSIKEKRFLRKCFAKNNYRYSASLFLDDFYDYFFQWDKIVSSEITVEGGTKISDLISLRNKYAHGATPSDAQCRKDVQIYLPLLKQLLQASWLLDTTIVTFGSNEKGEFKRIPLAHEPNSFPFDNVLSNFKNEHNVLPFQPYLIKKDGETLSLFPIMTCQRINDDSDLSLFFLNDLKKIKKKEISYLNYPFAFFINDHKIYNDFISILNIHEWEKNIPEEFKARIEELTENFQGRKEEQKYIQQLIQKRKKGFIFIFGQPGIGKSAFVASIIKGYKNTIDYDDIKNINKPVVIEYFIRRNSIFASLDRFLDSLNEQLEKQCKTKIPLGNTLEEKRSYLEDRLKVISKTTTRKIVIFIDGVDEGILNNFLPYLISSSYENILVVYSTRMIGEVDAFYRKIPAGEKERMILDGLTSNDIRGLLYKVTNKYDVINNPDYVDTILKKSSGNPLYLKLLSQELEQGYYSLKRKDQLPARLEDFYEEILQRMVNDRDGNLLLQGLYVFAVAREFLSTKFLEIVLAIGAADAESLINKLYEVLYEHPYEQKSYQLFHESFRQYLEETRSNQIRNAERKLVKFCEAWRELSYYSDEIKTYPFKHFSKHLLQLKDKKRLLELTNDEEYKLMQKKHLNQLLPQFEMYLDGMELFKDEEEQLIELAIKATDLHLTIGNFVPKLIRGVKSELGRLEDTLKQIHLFKGEEQFLMYVHLLYHLLNDPVLTNEEKQVRMKMVVAYYDEYIDIMVIGFNWCDYMSLTFMVELLVKIKKLGVDVTPFLQRSDVQNLDNDVIEYELANFDLSDEDYFHICNGLFLNKIYPPVLLSWIKLLCNRIREALDLTKEYLRDANLQVNSLIQIGVSIAKMESTQTDLQKTLPTSNEVFIQAITCGQQIKNESDRVSAYCSIAKGYHELGLIEERNQWQKNAMALSLNVKDFKNSSFCQREMALLINNFEGPLKAYNFIKNKTVDHWNKGIVLDNLIYQLYKMGEYKELQIMLQEMEKILNDTKEYRDLRFLIRCHAITLGKMGKTEEALEKLGQADEIWNRLRVLRNLSIEMAKKGENESFYQIVEHQPDIQSKLILVSGLVTVNCINSSLDTAQKVYEEASIQFATMKISRENTDVVNIHSSVHRKESTVDLNDWYSKKKEILTIYDEGMKPVQLAYLATSLFRKGLIKESENLMKYACDLVESIANSHNQAHALCEIAREYCKQGQVDIAIKLAEGIIYPWNVTPVYRQIAHELTKNGDFSSLFPIVKKQRMSIVVLVMMDEICQVIEPRGFHSLLKFLNEEIYSETIKTHAYMQLIKRMETWGESDDYYKLFLHLLPYVTYNKILISKCLLAISRFLKLREKDQTSLTLYNKFHTVISLPQQNSNTIVFSYSNVNDWIDMIDDEEDQLLVRQLVKRVKENRMDEETFESMVSAILG